MEHWATDVAEKSRVSCKPNLTTPAWLITITCEVMISQILPQTLWTRTSFSRLDLQALRYICKCPSLLWSLISFLFRCSPSSSQCTCICLQRSQRFQFVSKANVPSFRGLWMGGRETNALSGQAFLVLFLFFSSTLWRQLRVPPSSHSRTGRKPIFSLSYCDKTCETQDKSRHLSTDEMSLVWEPLGRTKLRTKIQTCLWPASAEWIFISILHIYVSFSHSMGAFLCSACTYTLQRAQGDNPFSFMGHIVKRSA